MIRALSVAFAGAACAVCALACSKGEPPDVEQTAAGAQLSSSGDLPAAATTGPSPPATVEASGDPARPPPSPADPTCDASAACPLNAWMKANSAPAMDAKDFGALASALRKIATFAPPVQDYPYWASIARDGADAARVQDLDATRAACRGCHTQYKEKYQRSLRARSL